MREARDFVETGMAFHGHKCPAVQLALRAGEHNGRETIESSIVGTFQINRDMTDHACDGPTPETSCIRRNTSGLIRGAL